MAIDKAVQRELEFSRSAVLRAESGADRETFAIMLSRLRSAADRVWFEHHGENLDVSDFYPDEMRFPESPTGIVKVVYPMSFAP